jgi:hypothetical protein
MNATSVISRENIDDGLCKAREITQRCADWRAWQKVHLYERYLRGNINIGVFPGRKPQGECLVFSVSPDFVFECAGGLPPSGPALQVSLSCDADEACMLSHNVHLMEGEQRIVPSFVRLELFDFVDVWGSKPLYLFHPTRIENVQTSGDGKVNFVNLRYAVASGERYSKNIERTAQGMDNDAGMNIDQSWRVGDIDFMRIHSAIRIELSRLGIRVRLEPGTDLGIKDLYLGYGPIDNGL